MLEYTLLKTTCLLQVPMSRIAGEVVDQLIASHNLSMDRNWGLFEVICGGYLGTYINSTVIRLKF